MTGIVLTHLNTEVCWKRAIWTGFLIAILFGSLLKTGHVEAGGREAVPVVIFFRPEQITVIVVLFVPLRGAER